MRRLGWLALAGGMGCVDGNGGTDSGGTPECVWDRDVVIENDADVEALEEVCQISGTLTASGSTATAIVLPKLVTIGGSVEIVGGDYLEEVSLPLLRSVGEAEDIEVSACPKLENVELSSLESARRIDINHLPLTALHLDAYTGGEDGLYVGYNPYLATLDLPALVETPGSLMVYSNALSDVDGLSSLESVGGDFDLSQLHATGLGGLASLEHVGGKVAIHDMTELASLDGLGSLGTVGGSVSLVRNPALESVDGFALTEVGSDVHVTDNASLPQCDVDAWLADVTVGGSVFTEDNAVCD